MLAGERTDLGQLPVPGAAARTASSITSSRVGGTSPKNFMVR
jgi:hypothetical protein